MTAQPTDADGSGSRPRPFQYSLRSLLVVTIVVALACTIFFACPVWVGVVAGFCMVLFTPIVLTIVLIHRPGYLRTFCTGALFPAGLLFLFAGLYCYVFLLVMFEGGPNGAPRVVLLIFLGVYWTLVVLSGLLAVLVRWRLEAPARRAARDAARGQEAPETDDPFRDHLDVTSEER
jgi:hypothetical protein